MDSALFSSPIVPVPSLLRPSPQRLQCNAIKRGINKTTSQAQERHTKALISQLEFMIQNDTKASTEFKWKASILFHELKRLIDSEHSSRLLCFTSDNRALRTIRPITKLSRMRATKQNGEKVDSSKTTFYCTVSPCRYVTTSVPDWKRHEETHWPQSRYMCLKCPVSTLDPVFSDALQCFFCSVFCLDIEELQVHLLMSCESGKENGRTLLGKTG